MSVIIQERTGFPPVVVGPAGATDGEVALFDGTSGKLIKGSGVNLSEKVDQTYLDARLIDVPGAAPTPTTGANYLYNIGEIGGVWTPGVTATVTGTETGIIAGGTLPTRTAYGQLRANSPAANNDLTNKQYVDGLFSGLGSAAGADIGDFASDTQGSLADTAIQPSDIGVTVQGYDVDTAKLDIESQPLSGGATVTSKDLGTITTGTVTANAGHRPQQHYVNDGAHTLSPGVANGSYLLDITNGASAGVITTAGWTKVAGDSFTTVDDDKFRCHCSIGPAGSLLIVQALQ